MNISASSEAAKSRVPETHEARSVDGRAPPSPQPRGPFPSRRPRQTAAPSPPKRLLPRCSPQHSACLPPPPPCRRSPRRAFPCSPPRREAHSRTYPQHRRASLPPRLAAASRPAPRLAPPYPNTGAFLAPLFPHARRPATRLRTRCARLPTGCARARGRRRAARCWATRASTSSAPKTFSAACKPQSRPSCPRWRQPPARPTTPCAWRRRSQP
jgi:hypothetical protein